MRSYFRELEEQLINDINQAPLTIEAKYYIVKSIFQEVAGTYQQWIATEEEQQSVEEKSDTTIEKVENEDGTVSITASGSDIGDVITQAVKETQSKNLD